MVEVLQVLKVEVEVVEAQEEVERKVTALEVGIEVEELKVVQKS